MENMRCASAHPCGMPHIGPDAVANPSYASPTMRLASASASALVPNFRPGAPYDRVVVEPGPEPRFITKQLRVALWK